MWSVGSRRIEVYLGRDVLGVRQVDAAPHWHATSSVAESLGALREFLIARSQRNRIMRVWLSASLARPFVVAADCGALGQQELQAVADSMAVGSTDLRGNLRVWTDVWRARQPCAAVAVEAELLEALRSISAKSGCTLDSVKPWWNLVQQVAPFDKARRGEAVLLWSVGERDGLTLGVVKGGRTVSLDGYGPSPYDPQFAQLRLRASLSAGAPSWQWHADADLRDQLGSSSLPIGAWHVKETPPSDALDGSANPSWAGQASK